MYLFKFLIEIIPWLLICLLFLNLIRMLVVNLIDKFSFSLGGLFSILLPLFFIVVTLVVIIVLLYVMRELFIELKKENFLSKYHFPLRLYLKKQQERKIMQLIKKSLFLLIFLLMDAYILHFMILSSINSKEAFIGLISIFFFIYILFITKTKIFIKDDYPKLTKSQKIMQTIKKSFSFSPFFILLSEALIFLDIIYRKDIIESMLIISIFILMFSSITIEKIEENIDNANLKFIQNYIFPSSVEVSLKDTYPLLTKSQIEEVVECLRLFFMGNLFYDSNTPSLVLNKAWRAFSLSDEYESFSYKVFNAYLPYEPILKDNGSNKIIDFIGMWKSECHAEGIDLFFPQRVPRMFMLDETLNITDGIKFQIEEIALRKILNIKYAPSPKQLINEIKDGNSKEYLARKLQYYLGNKAYCRLYQREELKKLLKKIQNSEHLSKMVFGAYSDIDFFIENVLKNSAPPLDVGCCSGASI